jgi:hypothetical protein
LQILHYAVDAAQNEPERRRRPSGEAQATSRPEQELNPTLRSRGRVIGGVARPEKHLHGHIVIRRHGARRPHFSTRKLEKRLLRSAAGLRVDRSPPFGVAAEELSQKYRREV